MGGIVFAKDNIDSSSQFGTMTDNLQSYSEDISGLPLFLAAAEEGGSASVLGNNDNLDEYYENSYSDDDSDYSYHQQIRYIAVQRPCLNRAQG